jgi:N-sulfoglucosamine sulfohydrolase
MKKNKKPDIVLIVSDDHGRDTGCYGNRVIKTPNLDALAADGILFENSFCTAATCSPSRSVILTGLFSHSNGMYGLQHSFHHFLCFDDVTSLPAYLQSEGYRTACAGKFHVGPEKVFRFQENIGDKFGRDDVKMSENCRSVIQRQEPFFLYWCSHNPHRGGGVVDSHPCKPDRFGNPEKSFPGDEETIYSEEEVVAPDYLSDTPEVKAELAQYYQSISRLDRGIGRLIQILKENNKYDNTLIIYVSDNGPAFPESKTTLYEPGMKLPCIVKRPQEEKKGSVCRRMISWVDLTPAILDFAGSKVPTGKFHGKSFKPVLEDENRKGQEEVYGSHSLHEITNYYPMRAVRTGKYKFIWNIAYPLTFPTTQDLWYSASWQGALRDNLEKFGKRSVDAYLHRPRYELYDLEKDPDEVINLAEEPAYREKIKEFCEKVKQFQEDTGDPWAYKWDHE